VRADVERAARIQRAFERALWEAKLASWRAAIEALRFQIVGVWTFKRLHAQQEHLRPRCRGPPVDRVSREALGRAL
jgi:hypothetical protein